MNKNLLFLIILGYCSHSNGMDAAQLAQAQAAAQAAKIAAENAQKAKQDRARQEIQDRQGNNR